MGSKFETAHVGSISVSSCTLKKCYWFSVIKDKRQLYRDFLFFNLENSKKSEFIFWRKGKILELQEALLTDLHLTKSPTYPILSLLSVILSDAHEPLVMKIAHCWFTTFWLSSTSIGWIVCAESICYCTYTFFSLFKYSILKFTFRGYSCMNFDILHCMYGLVCHNQSTRKFHCPPIPTPLLVFLQPF